MISLDPAAPGERPALENLMQLYVYDWSELGGLDVRANGRFADYPLDAYWRDDWHHPFLIRAGGQLAGYALVAARSRLTDAPGVHDMAEFFVMRGYRRKGVGRAAACAAFDRFPGRWEIRERDVNTAATAFWRRVVAHYTGGRYQEVRWADDAWTGPVQTFTTDERG